MRRLPALAAALSALALAASLANTSLTASATTPAPEDTTPPEFERIDAPPADVPAVALTELRYTARAYDDVDRYQVRRAVQVRQAAPGEQLGTWVTRQDSGDGRVEVMARPGSETCFRAYAVDRSDNIAGPSEVSCAAVPVDDRTLATVGEVGVRRANRLLGGRALELSGTEARVVLPRGPGLGRLWFGTGPELGFAVVYRGNEIVKRVNTRATDGGRLIVEVPRARLTVRAAGGKAILVDALGYRRTN